jgi:hypothetical protein
MRASLSLAIAAFLVTCKAPLAPSLARQTPNSPSQTATTASASAARVTSVPFVFHGAHAMKTATWLANGRLLAQSERELFVVDPESTLPVRVVALPPKAHLYAAPGARTFVVRDDERIRLYDSETQKPIRVLYEIPEKYRAGAGETGPRPGSVVLSPDGKRLAIERDEGAAFKWSIFNAESGDLVASTAAREMAQNNTYFSESNRFLISDSEGQLRIFDAQTGKELVHRALQRLDGGGFSNEYIQILAGVLFLSHGSEFEVFDLESGKPIAKTALLPAKPDEQLSVAHDPITKRVAILQNQHKIMTLLSYRAEHDKIVGVSKTRRYRFPVADFICPGNKMTEAAVHFCEHELDLVSGRIRDKGQWDSEPVPLAKGAGFALNGSNPESNLAPGTCELVHGGITRPLPLGSASRHAMVLRIRASVETVASCSA